MKNSIKRVAPVFYAIFDHPYDFPDSWVVRAFEMQSDGTGLPTTSYHLAATLLRARSLIPRGRCNIGRSDLDADSVFEVWI